MSRERIGLSFAVALSLLSVACRKDSPPSDAAAQPASAGEVDSIIPIEVALSRFRRDLTAPKGLHSDVTGRDELVRRVVVALSTGDTTAVEQLALNRAEYAWLYYPSTTIAKPPYELPPGLAWFQLQEKNRRGALRALRELGGHRVKVLGYQCAAAPTLEGDNRVWTRCTVRMSRDGAPPVSVRLFGAIIERGGRFEVLSYENDF